MISACFRNLTKISRNTINFFKENCGGAHESRKRKKVPKPPGPVLQYINKMLHVEPFSFLSHGVFWSLVLIVGCPLAGVVLLLTAVWNGVWALVSSNWTETSKVDAVRGDRELGVYITGCDSGFGKDLAFGLAERGFTVFAACLTEEGTKQYQQDERYHNVFPLRVDVTKDEDVAGATAFVRRWLDNDDHKDSNDEHDRVRPRVLHAVVNNAGVGNVGLVDWVDLDSFRRVMDVNFFGTVRTVKSFLPIVKEQVYARSHPDRCRVVNVVSAAGLVASLGAGAYSGSKHAAEAFTSCLRMELALFDVPVVSVSPSWHETPLSRSTARLVSNAWSGLDSETRDEYGEEYFSCFADYFMKKRKMEWNPEIVVKELLRCVETKNPPPQIIVGSEVRYFCMVVRLLPMWMQSKVYERLSPMVKAASMTRAGAHYQ